MTVSATKTPKRVFDTRVYKRLLGQAMPRPIENEKELARVQTEVDKLTSKPEDRLSPEESVEPLLQALRDAPVRELEPTFVSGQS